MGGAATRLGDGDAELAIYQAVKRGKVYLRRNIRSFLQSQVTPEESILLSVEGDENAARRPPNRLKLESAHRSSPTLRYIGHGINKRSHRQGHIRRFLNHRPNSKGPQRYNRTLHKLFPDILPLELSCSRPPPVRTKPYVVEQSETRRKIPDTDGSPEVSTRLRRRPQANYNVQKMFDDVIADFPKVSPVPPHVERRPIIFYNNQKRVCRTSETGFTCQFCKTSCRELHELLLHLRTDHSTFETHLEEDKLPQQISISVKISKTVITTLPEVDVFELRNPTQPFEISKFVKGDDSWIMGRLQRTQATPLSPSTSSGRSSPDISNDPGTPTKPATKQVLTVPNDMGKPMYDTATRRVLERGEEIPSSDDEKDEGWLRQRHKDILMDHSDLSAETKEYMVRWNDFVNLHPLPIAKRISRHIEKFVKINLVWFTEASHRKKEFLAHMATFRLRNVISQDCLHRCLNMLREAEGKMKRDVVMEEMAVEENYTPFQLQPRGLFICICGTAAHPPDRVICTAPGCCARFFHQKCAQLVKPHNAQSWHCQQCERAKSLGYLGLL